MSETATTAGNPATAEDTGGNHVADPNWWIPDALRPVWDLLQDYPSLRAALIILASWLLALLVRWLIMRISEKVTKRTKTRLDEQIIRHLRRPIFATVFYVGLSLATVSLGLDQRTTVVLIRIFASLATLIWMSAAFPISALLLASLARLSNRYEFIQERTVPLFDMVSKILIVAIAGYALLQIWRIDATAWLASAGVVGIAVGFAAKDTLANLFSGVFIVVDTPYKIGDFITLDSGERGMVTHVGIRSTRILTRDDIEITVPNAIIANGKIVNESGGRWPKTRLRIKIGVTYGANVRQVCEVLKAIGEGHPETCAEPSPRVRMRGFGESSLDFELLCWIEEAVDRGRITHDLLIAVYEGLNAAGIEIPYAKRDIYIKEMPHRKDDNVTFSPP